MNKILDEIKFTNELLVKVEGHLYELTKAPDVIEMAKQKKRLQDNPLDYMVEPDGNVEI